MTAETGGPGRRLTAEEEQRAAEMFARNCSTREVAAALGCGRATASRLRQRLAAEAAAPAAEPPAEGPELTPLRPFPLSMLPADAAVREAEAIVAGQRAAVGPETAVEIQEAGRDAMGGEIVDALTAKRAELAEALTAHQERAAASQTAIASLDAERLELLAAGRYAAPLRSRRADAEADLADSRTITGMIGAQLAEIDRQLAGYQAAQRGAEAQAARDEARIEGEQLAPVVAGKLRGVVTGDVAAAEFTGVVRRLVELEAKAGQSWDAGILPPPLLMPRDAWHQQVCALWSAARVGQLADVHGALAALGGVWQDRDREQLARERQAADDQLRQAREEADANMRRGRLHGGPMFLPEQPGFGAAMPPAHMFLDRAPVQGG